jgi:hypothetical protein
MANQEEIKLETLTEENENTGVVYRITNTKNGKKYIGSTSSYRICRGKQIKFGGLKRFAEHIHDALKDRNPSKFHDAIKEYGKNAFKYEQILICDKDKLNDYEIFYTELEDTTNDDIGYNIILGNIYPNMNNNVRITKISSSMIDKWQDPEYKDKTTKANLEAVKKRANEGKTRKEENKDLPANIYKNDDNGYDIRIMRDGKYKITSVTNINKSDEELLELAIKKRDELLKQIEEKGDFDRHQKKLDHNNNPLPKSIICMVARGTPGYQVAYEKAGKLIRKSFTDKSKTMDDKLDSAKKYLEELQNDFNDGYEKRTTHKKNDRNDHNNNPLPDEIFKYHQRGIDGYRCLIKKNDTQLKFICCGKTASMDDKLASCKKWLEENK